MILYKVHGTKNGKRTYLGAVKAETEVQALDIAKNKWRWVKDLQLRPAGKIIT